MPEITQSPHFLREIKKWDKVEKEIVRKAIQKIAENPFQEGLRTKKYKSMPGVMESSASMKIRILWRWAGANKIILEKVGYHDIL
jgi:mRNA-degrading endonuclease RelE of RelBE toxin-antitoxin system